MCRWTVLSSVLLLASACEGRGPSSPTAGSRTNEQVCEHARDRVDEMSELDAQMAVQDAPDDQKLTARERGKEITEAVHGKFVEVCLGLDADDRKCMSEIDGYADAILAARRGYSECRAKDPTACEQWETKIREAEAAFGRCVDVVEQASGQAWDLGRPKPTGPQIIGVMQQKDESFLDRPYDGPLPGEQPGEIPPNKPEPSKPIVDGPLDSAIVARIARAHMREIRACFDAGLSKNPELAGEVIIEFTIKLDGKVSGSKAIDPDGFGDPKVPTCIARAVGKWRFPKPGGSEVQVSYPFVLDPA